VSAQPSGQRFLTQPLMIADGGGGGGGWQPPPTANYNCPGCGREFAALGSLMQHQDARPQCRAGGAPPSHLAIGYGGY
jgi:hypothetical protein